ncbi:iron-containing alcohol dehydrogenase [Rheinheimera mesophila]|uniref:Iron-containing alcohol dehydrogenase n=1 Tax=Rheinheimera mesophila TaxID=1547515 RepID=A0A3P3QE91_9GAMM|nr:iron-containing alcohol dehydrogenase [Rheinheimera mesophila]KKL02067.1 aldehyde reductase [Rheinheimera mesophila]RRJ19385.1 iron-containing alcohol dehydrogenase [Rheinheimera mesophila]
MFNFSYQNPTRIVFGDGQISQLSQLIPTGSKVLLTYGGGSIKQNGVYQQVINALKGHSYLEFSGIEPNPSYETLSKAVALVKAEKIDFILAVGGGSVVDGSKYIAAAALLEQDGWAILEKKARIKAALPLGCVLTLPATGTESNANAVITRQSTQQKLAFSHPSVYPQFAILDPKVTYSLPAKQIANGVVDAFVHVMEQYLTYPVNAAVQDRFAESLLQVLIEEGPKALDQPENYDVRANVMWAATMALNGLIGVGVPQDWATHGLGHQLTALYGLDHAQTLAIVLPALMQQQRATKREKLLQYASRVWGLQQQDPERQIDEAIYHTRAFFEQMGVPTRLTAYGLPASVVDELMAKLMSQGMNKLGEHGDIDYQASRAIYTAAV